eukprot:CAMPEP_0116887926 /NCGR_PEP_ID=MMETSP0463-20121206/22642_1 /TAXON_ID=181622 /ORGANISM="Strombidinopsis sp, Strain SopsisLIS2011" /LENGTH=50 /DNA_ID=CAMNT_0004551567 /DNA_START=846 /DNA_END=998 /DNA_ORIENTATION=-
MDGSVAIEENMSDEFEDGGEMILSGLKQRLSMEPMAPTQKNLNKFDIHLK